MRVVLPLLNKPGVANINGIIYDKDSYIESIKNYIKKFKDAKMPVPISRYDSKFSRKGYSIAEFCICDPFLVIGKLIKFNKNNYTIELEIYDQYADEFKTDIDSYYIMLRMMASIYPDLHANIDEVICMEIHNDPANIAVKEEM